MQSPLKFMHSVLWMGWVVGKSRWKQAKKWRKSAPFWPHPTPYPTPYSKSLLRPHTVMYSIPPSTGNSGYREFIFNHQRISFHPPCITSSTNFKPASDQISSITESIRPAGGVRDEAEKMTILVPGSICGHHIWYIFILLCFECWEKKSINYCNKV